MTVAYIGTYTKKDSKGIYRVEISEVGKVEKIENVAEVENPTYLNFSHDNKNVYSVSKINDKGAVTSFKVEEDGRLTALSSIAQVGTPPCYVEVSPNNKYVLSANYHMGTIDSYEVGEDGRLTTLLSKDQHVGGVKLHPRQDKPYAHYCGFSRDGRFMISCDLGTDELTTYTVNNGILERIANFKLFSQHGIGPRHLVFSHDEQYVFVMTELSNELVSLDYNSETGELSNPKYYMTLPVNFIEENKGSAIRISNDDRFIYVTNRGQDAVVVFENKAGKLEKIQTISSYDKDPRDFNLSKDGKIAVAANENGSITVYTVNTETGHLIASDKKVALPEAVCVQFI